MTKFRRGLAAALLIWMFDALPAPSAALEHFLFYGAKKTKGTPEFERFAPVTLTDALRSAPYVIVKPRRLGVPASKNGENVEDPSTALIEYAVSQSASAAPFAARSQVPVADQCNDLVVTLKRPTSLLVPAGIDPSAPAAAPDLENNGLDHFLCYKAAADATLPDGSKAARLKRHAQVDVVDRFQSRRYELAALTKVCFPVATSSDPANPTVILVRPDKGAPKAIAEAAIHAADRYLVCYRARLAKRLVAQNGCGPADAKDRGTPISPAQPPHGPQTGLFATDQFGPQRFDTIAEHEICLPDARNDSDADGVPDIDDPCFATATGTTPVLPGCSALDVVQSTDQLLVPLRTHLAAILNTMGSATELDRLRQDLEAALPVLADGLAATRAADPCGGRATFAVGEAHLADAAGEIAALIRLARAAIERDVGQDDVNDSDGRLMDLSLLGDWITGLRNDAAAIGDALEATCAAATPFDMRGLAVGIRDDVRRIDFASGATVGLAEPIRVSGPAWAGRPLHVIGFNFGDGTALATDVSPDGTVPPIPPITAVECLRLRIAPVQRFAPVSKGPYTLHVPDDYDRNGTLYLEQGMRLAAVNVCKAKPTASVGGPRYSLGIDLTPDGGGPQSVALDLTAGAQPVGLPPVDSGATLTVHHQHQNCQVGPGLEIQCDDPVDSSVETFPVTFFKTGTACLVSYANGTQYDLDDQDPSAFRTTSVNGMLLFGGSETPPLFEAEGYPVTNGASSYPAVLPVQGAAVFALHNTDFFPILYQPVSGQLDFIGIYPLIAGVDHAAGLRWPHGRGKHNGHDFQYSCTLPTIVRDVVDFCPGTNAYYRLPWASDDQSWSEGQGNLPNCPDSKMNPMGVCCSSSTSCCTHAFGYAYDMQAPCLTPFRAARAGRVVGLDESQTMQDADTSCSVTTTPCGTTTACSSGAGANVLWIQHQDGSFVRYVHANQNQIAPEVGDYVKRGQLVGYVGMTGPTTGPHLHFGPKTVLVNSGSTQLALFEALDPANGNALLTCYEPKPNGTAGTCYGISSKSLRSNNKKQN